MGTLSPEDVEDCSFSRSLIAVLFRGETRLNKR